MMYTAQERNESLTWWRSMMKRWWILACLAIFAVVTVSVVIVLGSGVPVQVATVERGEIREYIDERGVTRVPRVYRITMPQAGRIEEILLSAGSPVKKGDVVAQIISEDLENAVAEALAVVERLDASIIENDDVSVEKSLALQAAEFVESMNKTVEAAQAQTEASGKRSDYAETNLGRIRQLHPAGASSEDDLDRATLQYWEGQLGFRQDTLTMESMRAIRAATALLPQMVADYIAHKSLSRSVLEKQKSEAQARLRQIMTQRERGTMSSPIDGVVLERLVENEQQLPAGTELLTIGKLSDLQVEADILSQDVVRVQRGDPVEIYGPAVGGGVGAGVMGRVLQIYPAGFTKVSSLGVEQQRVKVVVEISAAVIEKLRQLDVGVGFRVRVRIFTDQQPNALLVPRSALFRGPDGGWQIFAAVGHKAALRNVRVGLMNDSVAEIKDGLAEGESVILAPETSLSHATRIKPIAR